MAVMLPAMGATSAPDSLHIHGHRVLFFTAAVDGVCIVRAPQLDVRGSCMSQRNSSTHGTSLGAAIALACAGAAQNKLWSAHNAYARQRQRASPAGEGGRARWARMRAWAMQT